MKQPQGLARVEQSFIAAACNPALWDDALQVASEEFGATGAGLLPVVGSVPRLAVAPNTHELFDTFIKSGWYRNDQRRRGLPILLRDGAMIEHEFTNESDMSRAAFYQDFLFKSGFQWFAGMTLSAGDNLWCVAFQRRLGAEPFDFRDKARLVRWRRRLNAASNVAHELGRARDALIGDLLEALGKPCLLLGRMGDVVRMNARAEALLGAHATCRKGQLHFSDRLASETFAAAVRAVLDPNVALQSAGPIAVAREGRRPLVLSLVRLDFVDANPFAPAHILVTINDLDERPLATSDQLRQVFGLTGAEASLASLLSESGDLGDAADRLHITNETAKSHLKKIFQKTDTGRQTALLALIARLGGGK